MVKDYDSLSLVVVADLDAPVGRVCTAEVPIPYPAHLEQAALPQADTIRGTVRSLLRPS